MGGNWNHCPRPEGPSPVGCFLTPAQASGFSEYPFLQELNGVHKGGEAGAVAICVKVWSLQSGTPASLLLGWGLEMGSLAQGYFSEQGLKNSHISEALIFPGVPPH